VTIYQIWRVRFNVFCHFLLYLTHIQYDIMKREYSIIEPTADSKSSNFVLRLHRQSAKQAKREKPLDFSSYTDYSYAQSDVLRLEAHFSANKRPKTFQPDYDGSMFKRLSEEEMSTAALLTGQAPKEKTNGGVVAKRKSQRDDRMYSS